MQIIFLIINCISVLVPFFSQKKIDVFSPTTLCTLFLILYFVVSPLHLYFTNYILNTYTNILVSASLFIYAVLYLYLNKLNFKFKVFDKFEKMYSIRKKIILTRCYILFPVCIICYFCLYELVGESYLSALNNPLNFRYKLSNAGFITLFYSYTIKVFGILCITYLIISYKSRINFLIKSFFLSILNLILFLPLGSKAMILFAILKFVIVWNYFIKRIPIINVILLIPLVFIPGIYLQLTEIFHSNLNLSALTEINYFKAAAYILNRLDLLQNIDLFIISFLNKSIESNYFYSFISFFQQYIPRSYFEDKPYLFSTFMTLKIREDVFFNNVTYDFGLISESIYNFGIYLFFLPIAFVSFVLVLFNKIYFLKNPITVMGFLYFSFAFLPSSLFASGFLLTNSVVSFPLSFVPIIIMHILFFVSVKKS